MEKNWILIILTICLYCSCEKHENDYRDKWVGEYVGDDLSGSYYGHVTYSNRHTYVIKSDDSNCVYIKFGWGILLTEVMVDGNFCYRRGREISGRIYDDSICLYAEDVTALNAHPYYEVVAYKVNSVVPDSVYQSIVMETSNGNIIY